MIYIIAYDIADNKRCLRVNKTGSSELSVGDRVLVGGCG